MNKFLRSLLALTLAAAPAAALPSAEFDGASITVDAGEARLIRETIDESPTLRAAIRDAERNRTWRECYDERIVAAAVASWGSNIRAGYLKGTAAAYATYETAPGPLAVAGGGILWLAGVVYGLALTAIGIATTGHF